MADVNGKIVIEIDVNGDLDERFAQLKSKLNDVITNKRLKDGCLHMSSMTKIKNTAGHIVATIRLKDHNLF